MNYMMRLLFNFNQVITPKTQASQKEKAGCSRVIWDPLGVQRATAQRRHLAYFLFLFPPLFFCFFFFFWLFQSVPVNSIHSKFSSIFCYCFFHVPVSAMGQLWGVDICIFKNIYLRQTSSISYNFKINCSNYLV